MGPWPRARLFLALLLAATTATLAPRPAAGENASSPASSSFLSRHRRPLLIAAGAGAVAAGIAAMGSGMSQHRGEKYQTTADPERIALLYDETERHDNRAAILFVTSEVLFVSALVLGFFVEPAPARAAAEADLAPGHTPPPPHLTLAPQGLALAWRF
jgi:hypothetical protein